MVTTKASVIVCGRIPPNYLVLPQNIPQILKRVNSTGSITSSSGFGWS
jgi:hypothetical protein